METSPLVYQFQLDGFKGFAGENMHLRRPADQLTGRRKNKEEFPIELTITGILDERRMLLQRFIRDISSRRQPGRRAAAMKEKAEQAPSKITVLSVMSHELTDTLNAVIGIHT